MFGASNQAFEARTRNSIQIAPWMVPLYSVDDGGEWTDLMARQTADFDRDMIILTPGKVYPIYIRMPEDSIVRLSDLKLNIRAAETVLGRTRYLTAESGNAKTTRFFGTQSGYYDEVMVTAIDVGTSTPIFEEEVPASVFRGDVVRPRGKHALMDRNMPPRGIIQINLRHAGDTASLRVCGHLRGTRVRL